MTHGASDPDIALGPTCAKCSQPKKRVGKRWRCRPCESQYQREYMRGWYEKNREKSIETSREWAAAHREEAATRSRAWYAENKQRAAEAAAARYERDGELTRERNRESYRANPQPFLERARLSTWRQDNPEAARAVIARRRARKRQAICEHGPGCVSGQFLVGIYASQCHYCPAPAEHADHYVPLAKGGLHCQDNIVPACALCNCQKSAADPEEWLAGRQAM